MTHEDGLEHLQQLPGIGPFSAELILIRGAGNPDALPDHDTRLDDAIRSAYSTSDDTAIHQITESWHPYRAWVALLLRVELGCPAPRPLRAASLLSFERAVVVGETFLLAARSIQHVT